MEKRQSLQPSDCKGKLEQLHGKNETTLYKYKLKTGPNIQNLNIGYYKTPRKIQAEFFDLSLSNIFLDLSPKVMETKSKNK